MNYERVLLMIKDRCKDLELKIKKYDGATLEHGRVDFYEFCNKAIKEWKSEYDELNAAYSLLEKESIPF